MILVESKELRFASYIPKKADKIIEVCKTIPDGEGWDNLMLAKALGCSLRVVQKIGYIPYLAGYRIKRERHVFWVNQKTYAAETKG